MMFEMDKLFESRETKGSGVGTATDPAARANEPAEAQAPSQAAHEDYAAACRRYARLAGRRAS